MRGHDFSRSDEHLRTRAIQFLLGALFVLGVDVCSSADIKVANPQLLGELSPDGQAMLARDGMVACPTDYGQMTDIYALREHDDVPILVTADPLFHAFHVIYDYSLRTLELKEFYPSLQRMLTAMLLYETRMLDSVGDAKTRAATQANIAYLSVPLSYLDTGFQIPTVAREQVEGERKLIEAHAGFDQSPVTGLSEDFTQYIPRGHYTRSEQLTRYFKAMGFVGRTVLPLTRPDESEKLQPDLERTRQALLLADALDRGEVQMGDYPTTLWRRIHDLTSYLVGSTQSLLPSDYLNIARTDDRVKFAASDRVVTGFIAEAESLPAPGIVPGLLFPGESRGKFEGMSLFGQSCIPDALILQELVYDRVGTAEQPRSLPMGLDVMAAFGSSRAREILLEAYHQDQYRNYLSQLDSLRSSYSRLTPLEWNKNAYAGWLYALKLNLEPVVPLNSGSRIADFVPSEAWVDKTLVTSCGSWSELRHDVILYAQQTYAPLTGEPDWHWYDERRSELPRTVAYVEPKPEVFRQLARLASDMRERLTSERLDAGEIEDKLGDFARIGTELADIARGELEGADVSPDGAAFCKALGATLHQAVKFVDDDDPWTTTATDDKMALVADVVTDPTTEQVLEEAVGNPCKLYAVIPFHGQKHIAVGACYSYYEFAKPMSERMSDEQWQNALPSKPELPVWTRSFITQ